MKVAVAMVCGVLASSVALAQGAVPIYALSDDADPILLSQPEWDLSNPAAVQIVFTAENRTDRPLTARDVWVWVYRYYQPGENRMKNIQVPWDCARLGRIDGDQAAIRLRVERERAAVETVIDGVALPPGQPVQLRTPIRPDCAVNSAIHQHWALELERAGGAGSSDLAFWKRPMLLFLTKQTTLPK